MEICKRCNGFGRVAGHDSMAGYDKVSGTVPCPECGSTGRAPDVANKYRFVIEVFRGDGKTWQKVASVGETSTASSFVEAMPALNEGINAQWQKVVEMADIIDQDELEA